jgi:integrase
MTDKDSKAFSDFMAQPGMSNAMMEMLMSFSKVLASSNQAESKPKTSKAVKCQFTQKEINSMPQNYRKIFKVGTVVAHISKNKDNVYEVRCQINKVKYYGCSKKLDIAKKNFIEDLYKPTQTVVETKTERVQVVEQPQTSVSAFWYCKNWLENIKKNTIKERTYKGYLQLLNKNIREILGDKTLKNVSAMQLQTSFNEIIAQKHFRTAKKLKDLLGDMFKFAVGNGDITLNPMVNITIPKYDVEQGEAITLKEEKHCVTELIRTGDKYAQAIVFLAYTGLRIGELPSVKYENGWISCVSEKVRFGLKDKIRYIPVSPMLAKVLDHINIELIASLSSDTLGRHIKDYLPNRTSKDLRHTFITRCRECKIQREITSVWSGHVSDNSMTTKVYTHLAQNKKLQLEEIALFNYDL